MDFGLASFIITLALASGITGFGGGALMLSTFSRKGKHS